MTNKNSVCCLCNNEIVAKQPRFYFPQLPASHFLADINGIVHVSCLKDSDSTRKIGKTLADIAEAMARQNGSAPFISREGNIVLRYRASEKRIEVLDFEDFCEISIPASCLGQIQSLVTKESMSFGLQVLRVNDDASLAIEHKSPEFVVNLTDVTLARLKLILGSSTLQAISADG